MQTLTKNPSFNFDADTIDEAVVYIHNRARQLLRLNYKLLNIVTYNWGISAFFTKDSKVYQSIYILTSHRGKDNYKPNVKETILTSDQCGINNFLFGRNIDYVSENLEPFDEYKLISDFYIDKKARRSGVRLMNHIDEGLAILEWIGASEHAKKAYCLHPIFQSDTDLSENFGRYNIDSDIMLLTMEYRSVANEYLSSRTIKRPMAIRLSPLKDVNDMLIADKIQNYKDFEAYHKGIHLRSAILDDYFKNWLTRLEVSEETYENYKLKLR